MKKYIRLVVALGVTTSIYSQKTALDAMPHISAHWVNDKKTHQLKATYLQAEPIFNSFDQEHFNEHLLPSTPIAYRNDPTKQVSPTVLSKLAETAITELKAGKKKLTHFKILKKREFRSNKFVGTIILKYKDYPFVLKLFIENPKSFVTPTDKNIKHGVMAKMTGGLSRYLSGFTRIKNLEYAQHAMNTTPNLPITLDFPRKWFWLPRKTRWFEVHGKNFDDGLEHKAKLPEVYAIVADEIVGVKESAKLNKHQKRIYALCQRLDYNIDPNMLNFKIEKDSNKLVIIDTENFRRVIGIKGPIVAATHQGLRWQLVAKGIYDILFA